MTRRLRQPIRVAHIYVGGLGRKVKCINFSFRPEFFTYRIVSHRQHHATHDKSITFRLTDGKMEGKPEKGAILGIVPVSLFRLNCRHVYKRKGHAHLPRNITRQMRDLVVDILEEGERCPSPHLHDGSIRIPM